MEEQIVYFEFALLMDQTRFRTPMRGERAETALSSGILIRKVIGHDSVVRSECVRWMAGFDCGGVAPADRSAIKVRIQPGVADHLHAWFYAGLDEELLSKDPRLIVVRQADLDSLGEGDKRRIGSQFQDWFAAQVIGEECNFLRRFPIRSKQEISQAVTTRIANRGKTRAYVLLLDPTGKIEEVQAFSRKALTNTYAASRLSGSGAFGRSARIFKIAADHNSVHLLTYFALGREVMCSSFTQMLDGGELVMKVIEHLESLRVGDQYPAPHYPLSIYSDGGISSF